VLIALLELLRVRPWVGVTQLSSGGTVYGNPARVPVPEDAPCDPITSYGIVKLAAEKYIGMYAALYGVAARILRVGNAYGALQSSGRSQGVVAAVLAAARKGTPVRVFGDGLTVRDYIHVGDVAATTVELAQRADGPRLVNVGTGIGRTILDVVNVVRSVSGAELTVEHVPDRGCDVRAVVLDVGALRSLLDWDPVSLEEGIQRTWRDLHPRRALIEVG